MAQPAAADANELLHKLLLAAPIITLDGEVVMTTTPTKALRELHEVTCCTLQCLQQFTLVELDEFKTTVPQLKHGKKQWLHGFLSSTKVSGGGVSLKNRTYCFSLCP